MAWHCSEVVTVIVPILLGQCELGMVEELSCLPASNPSLCMI